jgi:hypothetical protein
MAMRTVPLDAHLMTKGNALTRRPARPVAVLFVLDIVEGLEFLSDHFHTNILSGQWIWVTRMEHPEHADVYSLTQLSMNSDNLSRTISRALSELGSHQIRTSSSSVPNSRMDEPER